MKKREQGVQYVRVADRYFSERGLRKYAGVWSLWALGVGAVISGDFPAQAESSSMEQSVLDEVLGRSVLDQAGAPMPIPLDQDL